MTLRRITISVALISAALAAATFMMGTPVPTNGYGVSETEVSVLTPPKKSSAKTDTVVDKIVDPVIAHKEIETPTVSVVTAAIAAVPTETKPEEKYNKEPYDKTARVGKGDTMMEILVKAGVERKEAHNAITALSKVYSPRKIRPGQEVTLTFQPDSQGANPDRFDGMILVPDIEEEVRVRRKIEGGFSAKKISKPLIRKLSRGAGAIDSSLYLAAMDADVPQSVIVELIRAYSWDVDFQRDIQKNDAFEVMYERFYTEEGKLARTGDILFASLTLRGDRKPIYQHKTKNGLIDFFDDKGQSAKKALMRTPINGARLSSGYGKRRHPILGYTKMHKGVDFAAPRGTPIYAAGDGVIEFAGRKGGYGKYIRIRHTNSYSTAYAHQSRFAKKMYKGRRVKQGQVIGYVGTTGRSTGPHLHYEILHKGRQTNPLRVKMPSGRKLKGKEFARFKKTKAELEQTYASLPMEAVVARVQ
ncbi:MAG: M23 family metallopeptidase [Rhodospirillales bacterium]|nr:M23 family metallopeptidase [Rhodospirillales bacterium]